MFDISGKFFRCFTVAMAMVALSLHATELDHQAKAAYDEIMEIKSYISENARKNYKDTWAVAGPKLDAWLDKYHEKVDLKQQAWVEWYAMIVRRRAEADWVVGDFERYLDRYGGKFPESFKAGGRNNKVLLSRYILPRAARALARDRDSKRFDLYLKNYFGTPGVPYEIYQLFAMEILNSQPGADWNPERLKDDIVAAAINSGGFSDALNKGLAELRAGGADVAKATIQGYAFKPFSGPTLDGKTVAISDYKGKVLLVDFWATWCGPCMAEMPVLVKLYSTYRDQGFEILGVSGDESGEADTIRETIEEAGMTWTQIYDNGLKEAQKLNGVKSIPYTILIDRLGTARYFSLRGEQIEEKVKLLLSETPEQSEVRKGKRAR